MSVGPRFRRLRVQIPLFLSCFLLSMKETLASLSFLLVFCLSGFLTILNLRASQCFLTLNEITLTFKFLLSFFSVLFWSSSSFFKHFSPHWNLEEASEGHLDIHVSILALISKRPGKKAYTTIFPIAPQKHVHTFFRNSDRYWTSFVEIFSKRG